MGGVAPAQNMPLVSVLVPILNEVRTIDGTLTSILEQSYPNLEVLAVDGMSDDGTLAKLERWTAADSRVRVLANPRKSIPAALNVGLAEARGTYLVRVDAHSTIGADYVARLVDHLQTGRWAGVGGKKTAVGSPPSGRAVAAALGSPFGVGGSTYHYASRATETDHIPFGAYRIDVARELEGWDERLVANEDYEFDVRVRAAGGLLYLDPGIEIAWRCRNRIRDLANQYRRYGRGKADVAFLHPSEVRLRHAAPPVVVATLVASVGLTPVSWVIPVAAWGGYGAMVAAMSVPIARTLSRPGDRIRVPGVLVAMHLGWGWGVWEGLGRIARNRFRLPEPSDDDSTRWGSPSWTVDEQPPFS